MKSRMPPKAQGRTHHFQTPDYAVRYVTQFVPKKWRIWECACGEGQIVDTLCSDGYDVVGTDIQTGFDFMDTLAPIPPCDMLLTNPPYDIKDRWLQRCYDIGKPFALLLPITALGEQGRVAMFKKYGIQLIMPPGRIMFVSPNGTTDGTWFYAAWFCHGLELPQQINFL